MTEGYSRSPGDRRAWLALAHSTAVAFGERSIMIRDFQPATIKSFSFPPSANQVVAKACRSWR
jgi:hypothetical protein